MRENDPDRIALLGGEIVMGLVGSEDNVGAITYSDSADVRWPLQPAGLAVQRQKLRQALKEVERNGITDFARALDRAGDRLEAGGAPRGSSVILLTDGVPYRGRRREVGGVTLESVVESFKTKGWRVFAIALGEEAQTPFLSLLVGKTGGSVFPVSNAGGLLKAFEDVSVEVLGYLRAEREEHDIEVVPHTGRLAFLGRWASGTTGSVAVVTKDGEEFPGGDVIRTPNGEASFAIALVEQPEPGTWSASLEGANERVSLIEPRFSLEFLPNQPPERVDGRQEVKLGVRLVGDPEAIAKVRSRLLVRAQLELMSKPRGRRFVLDPVPGRPFEFAATFRAPTVAEESSMRVVVEAVLVEGGRPYVMRRSRSLTVRPATGAGELAMSLEPESFHGELWKGQRPRPPTFTFYADPDETATITCGTLSFDLSAATTGTLTPPVSLRTKNLRFQAVGRAGAKWTQVVPVSLTTYSLTGRHRKGRKLPPTPAGFSTGSVPLQLGVAPVGSLTFSNGSLRGPGGARLDVSIGPAGLEAHPAEDLPPGQYKGTLEVRVADAPALPAKRLPLRIKVLPPLKLPDQIVVKGSWGWASLPVEIAWPAPKAVPVSISVGSLKGQEGAKGSMIKPDLDIRIVPLDGWKGKLLGTSPRRFALQIYLSSDLPSGDYLGRLGIKATRGGARALSFPVRLKVER